MTGEPKELSLSSRKNFRPLRFSGYTKVSELRGSKTRLVFSESDQRPRNPEPGKRLGELRSEDIGLGGG